MTFRIRACSQTFAGGVKQSSLEGDDLHVVQVFLDGHLDGKAGVRVDVGEGQQVRGTHKEVSVERVDGQSCREKKKKKLYLYSNKGVLYMN